MRLKCIQRCATATFFLLLSTLFLQPQLRPNPNRNDPLITPQAVISTPSAPPSSTVSPPPPTRKFKPFELNCHKVRSGCPPPYHTRNIASKEPSIQEHPRRVKLVEGTKRAEVETISLRNCGRKCLTLWDCENAFKQASLSSSIAAPLVDLCGEQVEVREMKVYEKVKRRQFGRCNGTDNVVVLDLFTHRIGFGSLIVHEVVDAIVRAYNRGWRLVLRGCGFPMGYLCELFHPSFGCQLTEDDYEQRVSYLAAGRHAKRSAPFLNKEPATRALPRWQQVNRKDEEKVKQLLLLYLRPSSLVRGKALDKMRSMGIACGDPFIGVHFRLGDKLVEEAKWQGTGAYIQVVNETVKATGVRRVVGISDSVAFLDYFKRTVQRLQVGWRFSYAENAEGISCVNQGKFCGHSAEAFGRMSFKRRRNETLELGSSVALMAQAQIFVGTASSNLFQLIRLLRSHPTSTVVDIETYNFTGLNNYGLD